MASSPQAEINIRKGKKLAVFEVAAKAEYEAWNGQAVEKGTLEVVEVYQDDMDEDFDVRSLRPGREHASGQPECQRLGERVGALDPRSLHVACGWLSGAPTFLLAASARPSVLHASAGPVRSHPPS